MDYHLNDRRTLLEFGADLDNPRLKKKYQSFREVWKRGNQKGQMPTGVLLDLAVGHQPKPEPEPKKEMAAK